MHRVIYIDVLFCVNFIIDFLLLLSVKKYLSLKSRYRRMVLGAAVGALSSFVILLPPLNEFLCVLIRIVTASAVVFAAFFPTDRKTFLKVGAAYFLVTFCFCGAAIALLMIFSPPIAVRNGAVYIELSPIVLVGTMFSCYLLMRLICRITGRSLPKSEFCRLTIENSGKSSELIAKTDTGNTLREPFSNLPVIVVEQEKLSGQMPSNIEEFLKVAPENSFESAAATGLRLVPYNSVGGEGVLPAFKPSAVKISVGGRVTEPDAYIAVTRRKLSESFSAIIPSEIISD